MFRSGRRISRAALATVAVTASLAAASGGIAAPPRCGEHCGEEDRGSAIPDGHPQAIRSPLRASLGT